MTKIRIIKKNNDCSMEYEVGDICEVTGTWYGGVHINGRSGIPVSLDKEEYMELNTEPEEPDSAENENTSEPPEHDIHAGDIVQHFKREWVSPDTSEYLYKVLAVAHHTENGEKLMIYQALYAPFKICARPYDMFMSEVDREKYPDIKQKYRFEKIYCKIEMIDILWNCYSKTGTSACTKIFCCCIVITNNNSTRFQRFYGII